MSLLVRLQKHLSQSKILSRRKAEEAIRKGLIKVNGKVAIIGQHIDPVNDVVELDHTLTSHTYTSILFHKPRGIITNCPQEGETEIRDLLPTHLKHLSSIGRLDKDSEGLILLTDDGTFANYYLNSTHPHERVYDVWLNKALETNQIEALENGLVILGKMTAPLTIEKLTENKLRWTMKEGKNRQIRRMIQKVGSHVVRLKRIQFDTYHLGSLNPGEFQIIKP